MDSKKYWVGFNLIRGVGAVRLHALLAFFGDLETAWAADPHQLAAAGLGPKTIERVVQARAGIDLDAVMQRIQRQGIQVITWGDEAYPALLRTIEQPPPVLYVRGKYLQSDSFAVALVGTRAVTSYGRQITEQLAALLAANGITVVSGLARGVDAVAHKCAMQAGGRTLAVLGGGVDTIYPPEHRALAEEIAQHGALISDYAPGTPPEASNFPPRNRIISGLSRAIVVIEAGESSGALITAEFAAEQGREIFAVPGSILAAQSKGTNRLIQSGAHPLLSVEDILQSLELSRNASVPRARRVTSSDESEARLLNFLSTEPLHIDEIRRQAGLPIEKVSATLALMELKGLIRSVGGMNYVSVHEEPAQYNAGGK